MPGRGLPSGVAPTEGTMWWQGGSADRDHDWLLGPDLGAAVCLDHRAHSGPARRYVGAGLHWGWRRAIAEVRPVPTSRRSHRRLTNTRLRFETSDLRPDESTTNIGLFKAGQAPSPSTSTSRC